VLFHTLIMSLIVILFSILFRHWFIASFLKNVDERHFLVALWLFPTFFLFQHGNAMLLGHKEFVAFNITAAVRNLVFLILLFILIPILELEGALYAAIIGIVVADFICFGWLFKHGMPRFSISFDFLKKAFAFGSKSQIGLLMSQINRRLDIFIINLFLTPGQVGYYAIAVAVAEFPWHISQAAATVLFPEASSMKKEEAYSFTAFICRVAAFMILCFCVVLYFLGGPLITVVFGIEFASSVVPLKILLPGIVALSVNKVLCAGFSGTGRPEYGTYTAAIASVMTITLDFLLIPLLGITGAAIASTTAYFAAAITAVILFRSLSGLSIIDYLLIKKRDIDRLPTLFKILTKSSEKSNYPHRR
jgi:O-antigen/teichoic acid export membrane protein